MKIHAISILILISSLITGCGNDFLSAPKKEPVVITSIEVLNKGEPDGYRGKAIRIGTANKIRNRTITYTINIETKNNFKVSGGGYLSSRNSPHPATDTILENMYLWVPRHDESDMWRIITEEISPGNIKDMKIILSESEKQIGVFKFSDL